MVLIRHTKGVNIWYNTHGRKKVSTKTNYIAQNIQLLRKKRKLTQKEFAEQLGVSKSVVCFWETGKRLPNGKQIMKLCEVFNIEATQLYKKKRRSPIGIPETCSLETQDEIDECIKTLNEKIGKENMLILAKEIINKYV